ncbi:MAG TPA: TfoX/Sxy family protein [Jatrophihabitantaceae bacterium]|jgi:hypothetical protein
MAYNIELANRLREQVQGDTGVTEEAMFGGLAFLINGHMAVAASREGGLLLRIDPEQTDALVAAPHARPFVMRGRELDGWLRIDPDGLTTDAELERWVSRGVAYARSLSPK